MAKRQRQRLVSPSQHVLQPPPQPQSICSSVPVSKEKERSHNAELKSLRLSEAKYCRVESNIHRAHGPASRSSAAIRSSLSPASLPQPWLAAQAASKRLQLNQQLQPV